MELTCKVDLRELNELNFARFDARLEQRLVEVRAEIRQELAALWIELGGFRVELGGLRVELIRWMFGFWVTTLLALAGTLIALRAQ